MFLAVARNEHRPAHLAGFRLLGRTVARLLIRFRMTRRTKYFHFQRFAVVVVVTLQPLGCRRPASLALVARWYRPLGTASRCVAFYGFQSPCEISENPSAILQNRARVDHRLRPPESCHVCPVISSASVLSADSRLGIFSESATSLRNAVSMGSCLSVEFSFLLRRSCRVCMVVPVVLVATTKTLSLICGAPTAAAGMQFHSQSYPICPNSPRTLSSPLVSNAATFSNTTIRGLSCRTTRTTSKNNPLRSPSSPAPRPA